MHPKPFIPVSLDGLAKAGKRKGCRVDDNVEGISSTSASSFQAVTLDRKVKRYSHMAAIYAIAQMFLFSIPSECVSLTIAGPHSETELGQDSVTITLMRRKPNRIPSSLGLTCSCAAAGRSFCACHWLQKRIGVAIANWQQMVFTKSVTQFSVRFANRQQ